MTDEKAKELAAELLPHLEAINEITKKINDPEHLVGASFDSDGYIRFTFEDYTIGRLDRSRPIKLSKAFPAPLYERDVCILKDPGDGHLQRSNT